MSDKHKQGQLETNQEKKGSRKLWASYNSITEYLVFVE